MAREILKVRNAEMQADYNRLKAEEQSIIVKGKKTYVRLTYSQILVILSQLYFISVRRVEVLVAQAETTLAPLKSKANQSN